MPDPWRNDAFIVETAAGNRWQWSKTGPRTFLISGAESGLSWRCKLEQSLTGDHGPESMVDWICPAIAITDSHARQGIEALKAWERNPDAPVSIPVPQLNVRYAARKIRQSGFKSLFAPSVPDLEILDTAGVLDGSLEQRLRQWPDAYTANGSQRPARLGYLRVEADGFRLRSEGWWASSAALTHQIKLGVDLALRLKPFFR